MFARYTLHTKYIKQRRRLSGLLHQEEEVLCVRWRQLDGMVHRTMATAQLNKDKVVSKYTHRALDSEQIGSHPAGYINHNRAVGCAFRQVTFPAAGHHRSWPDYTAWWQRHTGTNNLPNVTAAVRRHPANTRTPQSIDCRSDAPPRDALLKQYSTRCSAIAERPHCKVRYSFGQKWKTRTGRQYFTDIIGLTSTTVI